jgi:putative hydrolase of the HAD superfamily
MYSSLPPKLKVKLMKGASKILVWLREKHELAIVTGGEPHFQKEKWENAGIDSSKFSKIVVADKCEKKFHYQEILTELKRLPQETIVVGDRIGRDLAPAKELGMTTIHMRWGRGLQYENGQGVVDYTISDLEEIKKILHHLELSVSAVQ